MSGMDQYEKYVEQRRPATGDAQPELACGADCSKKFLITMNVLFLILGAAVIGLGAYALNSNSTPLVSKSLPVGAMILGGFIMFVAFLGCCGASRESRFWLFVYATVLFLLIIAQIAVASFILFDRSRVDTIIRDGWTHASADVQTDIQDEFKCCGFDADTPPRTGATCPTGTSPTTGPFCYAQIRDDIVSRWEILGGIGIALGLFEILGVVFSSCLRGGIRKRQEEEERQDLYTAARSY